MTETAEMTVLAETAVMEPEEAFAAELPAPPMAVGGLVEVEVKRWHGAADSRVYGWQRMSS